MRLSPAEVFDALLRPDQASDRALDVVRKVRLQRTVAAGLSGAALGLCGAQMQTIFRNPLADPFVLGITGGASFGVAIVVLIAGTGVVAVDRRARRRRQAGDHAARRSSERWP